MDDHTLDRVWETQLSLWFKSKEAERRRAALRFYAIALPGLVASLALGWLTLKYTGVFEVAMAVGGGLALGFSWLGYGPLGAMQSDYRHQILARVGGAFGMKYDARAPAGFPIAAFHQHDLVFSAPGGLDHHFHGESDGRLFGAARAEFTYKRADDEMLQRRNTDFSGVLLCLELEKRPAGEVILTRESEWFSELSRTGSSFSARQLNLIDLGTRDVGGPYKAFCESQAIAESVVTAGLLAGLTALEASFSGRPLRLAIVPVGQGGACYVAIDTSGVFEGFSILEDLEQRRRFDSLLREMAGIMNLVDLVVREIDGVDERDVEPNDSLAGAST